ncbi:MAG: response regulator [Planctomycetes bacterium]|nr:response regulator [Planctomycetota bacterium]
MTSTSRELRPPVGGLLSQYAESIVQTMREPLVILAADLSIVFVNRSFSQHFGVRPKDVVGQKLYDIRGGEWDLPQLRQLLEEILPRDAEFADFEVQQHFAGLGQRTMMLNARRLRGEGADRGLLLLVVSDVSQRRSDEIEQARLAAIVESSQDAIILQTLEGTITHWNHGAERIYGFSAEEAIGRPISLITPAECIDQMKEYSGKLRSGKRLRPFETVRMRKDGRKVHVSLTMSPLADPTGRVTSISNIERDISRRVEMEHELRIARDRAEAATRAQSEFLANISHELRTPMNAIIGMTDLALDEDLAPQVRDYLETARASADVLLELLNEVLDFSKLESGEFDLDLEPFSLSDLLESTIKTLGLRAYEKGLELACDVAPGIPDRLIGDPLRLRQVITNLASNAIKFTDQGEVVVSVEPMSRLEGELRLKFCVRDTGIGIAPEDQERIFEPFTQADASTTRSYSGTGLGLAIVSQLVLRMGGRVWVESRLGEGSAFHFSVHFGVAAEPSPPTERQERVEQLRDLPVLVVDDNETNRRIVARALENWSMHPVVATDGKSALRLMREAADRNRRFPLVILDALMPEMDGFTLAKEIEADPRLAEATILMLSSADRQAFRQRFRDLPIGAFLEKPVTQSDLLDTIVTTLGGVPLESDEFERVAEERPPKRRLHVLMAEDTPANQKVVEHILEKRGHQVQVAHNGREVLDLLYEQTFDVVLMDVQMPIVDGFQATAAIRGMTGESWCRIPIVAMTAHAMRGDRERCLAAGMDAYISKPVEAKRLIRTIERIAEPCGPPLKSSVEDSDRDGELPSRGGLRSWTNRPVDLSKALDRVGGDESLLKEVAGFFLEDAPLLMQSMETGLEEREARAVERAAHSLRGLASNFEARQTVEVALAIEEASAREDLEAASGRLDRLKCELERVTTALEAFRKA